MMRAPLFSAVLLIALLTQPTHAKSAPPIAPGKLVDGNTDFALKREQKLQPPQQ